MSLSQDFVEMFEQLPIVPLAQIAENINNFHDLVKLAFKSKKWRSVLTIGPRKTTRTSLALKIDENHCEVSTTVHPRFGKSVEKTFILMEQDNLDIQGVNCYHQNLRDVLHFFHTKFPTISYSRIEIFDAKWMRISDFMKINCFRATFGANRLKTQDLRVFLLNWFNGISCQTAQHYTFQMSQEQVEELNLKEVLKDLRAVPWDPKRRDRKFLTNNSDGICHPIDLADGYDTRHPDGTLATIHLDPNTRILHFCVWSCVFEMEYAAELTLESVVLTNQQLARDDMVPEERFRYEERRKGYLQSLRYLRNDQNLDVTDVVYEKRN